MSEPLQQLQTTLQANNVSVTNPRQLVFQALLDHEPQTMHQIVAACSDQIDRASVYRTITLFERLGIVQRLQMGWKYKLELTDNFMHHHHHLTCTTCGRVIPLAEDNQLEEQLHALATTRGFEPHDHQLEIRGICDSCQ